MALTFNHQTNEISNDGVITVGGVAVGGDNSPYFGDRGLFGGGYGSTSTIDYITISSTGNATDFGDLSVARYRLASCAGSGRGLFAGGVSSTDTIDYVTIATTGNAADFG